MFHTLTAFYAWLSVNATEGNTYTDKCVKVCYPGQNSTAAQTKQDMQDYLAPHLQQANIDLIIAACQANDKEAIPDAISNEQLGPIQGSFDNTLTIWAVPSR